MRNMPQAFQVMPLMVWKVYPDGRPDELVRGVDIIGTPLNALNRIILTGTKMAVFNGRHFDICVLIDQPGADIMTEEHIGYRHRAASVRYPDLGADAAILDGSLD